MKVHFGRRGARGKATQSVVWALLALALVAPRVGADAVTDLSEDGGERQLVIMTGDVKVLDMPATISFVAGGSQRVCIAKTNRTPPKVILTATGPGTTSLRVDLANGTSRRFEIVVVESMPHLQHELETLFANIEGLEVEASGAFIVLSGDLYRLRDARLVRTATVDMNRVINRCRLSPGALALLAETIATTIDHPDVHTEVVAQKLIVSGRVYHEAERKRAMAIATELAGDLVEDALVIVSGRAPLNRGRQVHFEVRVAEVGRGALSQTGFQWPTSTGLAVAGQASVALKGSKLGPLRGQLTGTIANFLPVLNHLAETGQVQNQSTMQLSCRSGETATSHSGGEIPVPVAQSTGVNTIEYKEHGLFVEVQPVLDNDGNIDLQLSVDLKLVSGESSNGPSFLVHNVRTNALLRPDETFVLAGFVDSRLRRTLSGLPLLKDIPLVGRVFSSKRFQKEQTDLVLFITPTVRDAASGSTTDELAYLEHVRNALAKGER